MPDALTAPTGTPGAAPATQADPKTTANNIATAIHEKVNGKAPAAQPPINGEAKPPVNPSANGGSQQDPNAGKRKYVFAGKEVWLTPEQADTYVSKGMAFDHRADDFARMQKETQQLYTNLLTDPGAVLANVAKMNNVPLENIVQKVLSSNVSDSIKEAVGKWYYEEAVEPMKMTEEQKKAREDAKWRQQREQQDKIDQENAIKQENHQKFLRAMGEIKANIAEAMKDSGLPSNDTPLGAEMARMVADVMRTAYFARRTVTPKQAIEMVKGRVRSVQAAYYDHLEGQALIDQLGEKTVAKIQAHFVKLAQDRQNQPNLNNGAQHKPPKQTFRNGERQNVMSMDDFHDRMDKIKRGEKP